MISNRRAVICSKREAEELVFWTTCGPATTFDPKITGPNGTWYFDDGTTLEAASGAEISKTFAADGLHRAVYRPVGGRATMTAIDAPTDSIVTDLTVFKDLTNITNLSLSYNDAITGSLADIANLTKITELYLSGLPEIGGSLSDLAGMTSLAYCFMSGCPGIGPGSVASNIALRYLYVGSMQWVTDEVDQVINAIWAARATYTKPLIEMDIAGNNQAPTGTTTGAPSEGADWHEDTPGHWVPLTAGAKINDLENNVNSETLAATWAITRSSP